MPIKRSSNADHPNKRPRVESTPKFTNVSQLRAALNADAPEEVTVALTSLRNQLTIKPQEPTILPQDERLVLVREWMETSSGAYDLLMLWDKTTVRQANVIALIVSILSSILTLLSSHYNNHALGQPIMKSLLTPSRLRHLNSYIGGSNNELVIVTLRLFNVMSSFASGRDRKSVLEGFGWEIKSLPKLLNMRRKTHGELDTTNPLSRPDIRTLYIQFLLSFVDVDNSSQTKSLFLEQHREAFLAIFKGIAQDHYSFARRVLEVCWAGIWSDSKLKRTLKVGLFNESTLGHIIKLYERILPEGDDEDQIPADLAHHFLLAICTRPGTGICFRDRGWYPKESDPNETVSKDDEDGKRKNSKIYNKILANLLKSLKVNEDSRQQELALKILSACPELVAGYWSAAALTLEPRLASKWITNIAVFGSIISLPIPSSTFYLPNTQQYQPTPPPLSIIIESILPSVNTKNNFSKGLQSPSGLVQHCTALALTRCLVKYQTVKGHFRKIAAVLEEDEEEGQWYKRCRDLERDVRRRVPDFQVLVAFSQQKVDPKVQSNPTKLALLAESAQRLLWLYHRCLPSVVAEVRFDVGKLLQAFSTDGDKPELADEPEASTRLYRIQQLHTLSLLKNSDQFVWTSKIALLSQTPFYILLSSLSSSGIPAIRIAITSLLEHILSQSILFQEDSDEPDLWLKALPVKGPTLLGSDDSLFQGETEGVITFFDECVQRCLKTPYRYVEALHTLIHPSNTTAGPPERLETYPSPLLMTFVEQLDAKINNKSLQPSQIFGVVTFLRKLVFNLTSKTTDLYFLRQFESKLETVLRTDRLEPILSKSLSVIEREMSILRQNLLFSSFAPPVPSDLQTNDEYIARFENMPVSDVKEVRLSRTLELKEWLRSSISPLGTDDLSRVLAIVLAQEPSSLPSFLEVLIPGQGNVWVALNLQFKFSELRTLLHFNMLYINTSAAEIVDESCQTILSDTIFVATPRFNDVVRNVHLILHFIASSRENPAVLKGHLKLLARVLKTASSVISPVDYSALKEIIFAHPGGLKDLLTSNLASEVLEGIVFLLESAVQFASESDRILLSDISGYWFNAIVADSSNQLGESVSTARIWIKYLEPSQLFDLLDFLEHNFKKEQSKRVLIDVVLQVLGSMGTLDWHSEHTLAERLPQLVSLRDSMQDSELLEGLVSVAIEASLPIGVDGCSVVPSSSDIVDVTRRAVGRWTQHKRSLKIELDIRSFLSKGKFSTSTAKTVCGLMYRQPYPHDIFIDWFKTADCLQMDDECSIPIIHAFLDSSDFSAGSPVGLDVWQPYIPKFIAAIARSSSSAVLGHQARQSLVDIVSIFKSEPTNILSILQKEFDVLPGKDLSPEIILTGAMLAHVLQLKDNVAVSRLLDRSMQLCINKIAEDPEASGLSRFMEELEYLVQQAGSSKAHLVETLLTVIIQNCFSSVAAISLAISCLSSCSLKPLVVNRTLQSVIQHPHFFKVCLSSSAELFGITHIEPLIKIYRGTLSPSDLRILSVFQLFEVQKKLSVAPLLARWSSNPITPSHTALEAIQSLDPVIVLKTCLNFPRWRSLEDQSKISIEPHEAGLYDPVFLMLLFSQVLSEEPPTSAFAWIELFRTNVASLFIRALSSKDVHIRDLALCQVVALWKHMQTADLQEKPHVLHLLNLLKDLMPTPVFNSLTEVDNPRRLPTYTSLLLMHALRAIFNPSNFVYPITARFLLQRPYLDTDDVPMLYGLLYSSADDSWKKERTWIIKFLADGMVSSEDWRVLKRRHTWDLMASLFQSAKEDEEASLRMAIIEVLANLTCNMQAAMSLTLKSALLPWIEMQILQSSSKSEGVEWIKILENILVIVDEKKIEASTNGEWRVIICRCLVYLIDIENCSTALQTFPHAVPVILRLSSLGGPPLSELANLLDLAVKCLEKFEQNIEFEDNLNAPGGSDLQLLPCPPHRSVTIHQRWSHTTSSVSGARNLASELLEMLWKASMSMTQKCDAWDKLTPRLLLMNTLRHKRRSENIDVAEWARKEVVRNLHM
uniref:Nucleolar pre-ribosomal-associated protein 1 n=1 Tax=Psilocybe cubensis TaxID=181762 RepID=A0A8H8CE92_PSICU